MKTLDISRRQRDLNLESLAQAIRMLKAAYLQPNSTMTSETYKGTLDSLQISVSIYEDIFISATDDFQARQREECA